MLKPAVAALEADRLMTAQEVSTHLGIPLQMLYRWRMEKKGPTAVRVGKYLRFTQVSVAEWIAAQTESR